MGLKLDSAAASASQEKTLTLESQVVKLEKTISELQRTTSMMEQRRALPQKMKLPVYGGQNPGNWVFQMEMRFTVNKTPEEKKLDLALACMEGRAVPWARITHDREDLKSWGDFKEKLKQRFGMTSRMAIEQILKLKQTGSVAEYRELFEELAAEILDLPNDALEGFFVHGLKENLRYKVGLHRWTGMNEIVDMGMMIEEMEVDQSS